MDSRPSTTRQVCPTRHRPLQHRTATDAPLQPQVNLPTTQLQRPQLRATTVPRERLVTRLLGAALQHRVCLLRAPGGYGKTTLLSQLAAAGAETGRARVLWLTLSERENDLNRLVVGLLAALGGVPLRWPVDPSLLAAQATAGGPHADAAMAVIVDALAGWRGERLLIVLDDLHHVSDRATLALLARWIDRLPATTGVVIGARAAGGLPLPRWRVRQELVELGAEDLAFDGDDARALVRLGAVPPADADTVAQALRRCEGWAAGLQVLLGARAGGGAVPPRPAAEQTLFEYFAEESLAALPPPTLEFLLRCSILETLSPGPCRAVSGREDAAAVLATLHEHSVFVSVLDSAVPVLKLHDLFADGLRRRLALRGPAELRNLHACAATAETPVRAVAHWLAAEVWPAALGQMAVAAPALLAEGGTATLARWLAALPSAFSQDNGDVLQLQAVVAIQHWDFGAAIAATERAAAAHAAAGRQADVRQCVVQLARLCHAVGLLDAAAEWLARADALPLDADQRLLADTARLWQAVASQPDACAGLLDRVEAQLQARPALLATAVENLCAPQFHGMRGVQPAMRRLRDHCRREVAAGGAPWQTRTMAATAWPELWRGDVAEAEAALALAEPLQATLAVVPVMRFNRLGELAFAALARGELAASVALQRDINAQMVHISPAFTATWGRVIGFALAHRLWVAGDHEALLTLWPQLASPRTGVEYPVIDTQRMRFEGHVAWIGGDLAKAQRCLAEAARLHGQWRVPTLCGDPRPSLAALRLAQGDPAGAWAAFEPLFHEMLEDDCIGPLLMEAPAVRAALAELVPAGLRDRGEVMALLRRLAAWQREGAAVSDPLLALSRREREVLERLAAGAGNQHIADSLHLSLHTVKRHVASVLQKLQCRTRGEAAARWHAMQDGRVSAPRN